MLSGNIVCRVDVLAVYSYLEMEMCSGGVSGGAHCGDDVALVYILTLFYIDVAAVSIKGLNSVAVVDDEVITITGVAPFYFNNGACGGSIDV